MQSILHHNSSGRNAFTGKLKSKEIHNAITLHPVKHPPLMYRLHSYIQGLRAQELRQETLYLHRDIAMMKSILLAKSDEINIDSSIFPSNEPDDSDFFGDHEILSMKPHLNKMKANTRQELLTWNYISRSFYSAEQSNPKKKIDSSMRESLNDVIVEVMDYINNFSRQRGRVIDFKEVLYGYTRLNSLYGQDMVLDLLLIYKKYRGKKMTVPVRRHLYLQRAFTDCFVREIPIERNVIEETGTTSKLYHTYIDINSINLTLFCFIVAEFGNLTSMFSLKVKDIWKSSVDRISDTIALSSNGTAVKKKPEQKTSRIKAKIGDPTIVFVLPLAGRFQTYKRFLKNYEEVCLKHPKTRTELLVVLFKENNTSLSPFEDKISRLRAKYSKSIMNYSTVLGNFSRGIALNQAIHSDHIQMDDIIFFIDVDITFKPISIERIRMNTKKHKQVYLPIVFSQYNPKKWDNTDTKSTSIPSDYDDMNSFDLNAETGYFRQFGYGICAIYKADIINPAINGFNDDITGWGLEDVKFLEKIVKIQQTPITAILNSAPVTTQSNPEPTKSLLLSIFRAPDPSLVHIYHDIVCDKSLSESQYSMCLGTKANTLGSFRYIENILMKNQSIIDFIRSTNTMS